MNGTGKHDVMIDIYAAVRDVLPGVDPAALDPGAVLVDVLDLDSFDHAALLEAIGDRAGVDIHEDDLDQVRTIDELAAYVAARARARGRACG